MRIMIIENIKNMLIFASIEKIYQGGKREREREGKLEKPERCKPIES